MKLTIDQLPVVGSTYRKSGKTYTVERVYFGDEGRQVVVLLEDSGVRTEMPPEQFAASRFIKAESVTS